MALRTVTARNWATASENRIHDNEVARSYGFGGGLVPGVTLFAYLVGPIIDAWGFSWLAHGRASARFVFPIYDGDEVSAELADDGQLLLRDGNGRVCVTGSASRDAMPASDVPKIPEAPLPATRPPANEESLSAGRVLGSLHHGVALDNAALYLDRVGEDTERWTDAGFAHPGWLLLDANNVLAANVRLGPWIHAASDVHLLAPVRDGHQLTVTARVVERYERKGHRMVDLDVVTSADREPVMYVRHTAIYEPRTPSSK